MRTATDFGSTIVNDDCLNALRSLQNASVDFVLTDPPYVSLYTDRNGRIVANEQSPKQVSEAWWQVARVLKPNKLCFTFYSWAHIDTSAQAWILAGLKPVGHIVFSKPYSTGQLYTRYAHECGYLLAKGTPNPPAHPLPDVMPWHYSGNRRHPTEKSVDTLKPIIEAFTQAGDLVLDPYAGSGSTLVASALLIRRYIGIEIDAKYCEGARRRASAAKRTDGSETVLADIVTPKGNNDEPPLANGSIMRVILGGFFQFEEMKGLQPIPMVRTTL